MGDIVCILDPKCAAVVDRPLLTSALGVQTQLGSLGGPDLLLSSAGFSIAFINAPSYDDTISQRMNRSSSLFTRLIVLSHYSMFAQQECLSKLMTAACLLGNTSMVLMPVGSTFTQQAIIHAQALFEVERKKKQEETPRKISWYHNQLRLLQSSEVGSHIIAGGLAATAQPTAGPGGAPAQRRVLDGDRWLDEADLLRMMGSVSYITLLPSDTIAAQSGIQPQHAAAFTAMVAQQQPSNTPPGPPQHGENI